MDKKAFLNFVEKTAGLSARNFISDRSFAPPQGMTTHSVPGNSGVSMRGVMSGGEGLKSIKQNNLLGQMAASRYSPKPNVGMAAASRAVSPAAAAAPMAQAASAAKPGLLSGLKGNARLALGGLGVLAAYKMLNSPSQHQDYVQQAGGLPYVQ